MFNATNIKAIELSDAKRLSGAIIRALKFANNYPKFNSLIFYNRAIVNDKLFLQAKKYCEKMFIFRKVHIFKSRIGIFAYAKIYYYNPYSKKSRLQMICINDGKLAPCSSKQFKRICNACEGIVPC